MITEKITYFEKKGPENTVEALKLAIETARQLGIENIVLASSGGTTAKAMAELDHEGLTVTVVTSAYGQTAPGANNFSKELRKELTEKGFQICTAAHALSGAERSLSGLFKGVYPVEIIAHTLRMFGQGTKVCVEISAMAADAGLLIGGEPVVAVGGTGAGADTVMVLRPEVTSKIMNTKIDRIICKPIE